MEERRIQSQIIHDLNTPSYSYNDDSKGNMAEACFICSRFVRMVHKLGDLLSSL